MHQLDSLYHHTNIVVANRSIISTTYRVHDTTKYTHIIANSIHLSLYLESKNVIEYTTN